MAEIKNRVHVIMRSTYCRYRPDRGGSRRYTSEEQLSSYNGLAAPEKEITDNSWRFAEKILGRKFWGKESNTRTELSRVHGGIS